MKGNPNRCRAEPNIAGTQHTRQIVVGKETLFLPPGPVQWANCEMKTVKRRRVAKGRDVRRRRDRAAKRADCTQGF